MGLTWKQEIQILSDTKLVEYKFQLEKEIQFIDCEIKARLTDTKNILDY